MRPIAVALSLAASGIYLVNDILDSDADRRHWAKRHRAVASGALAVRHAIAGAGTLIVVGLVLGALSGWTVLACLVGHCAFHSETHKREAAGQR